MKRLLALSTALLLSFSSLTSAAASSVSGKVLQAKNSGGYSYVLLDLGEEQRWYAGPAMVIKVGDKVTINEQGIPMENFHSKSLNQDFDVIYFVNRIVTGSEQQAIYSSGRQTAGAGVASNIKVAPYQGGKTVAEIFTQREKLASEQVTVRAKVVKSTANIMGKNWLHIQDGTRDEKSGAHDITVTTADSAQVGDTVVINATVTLNKDFGYGYKYALILEDAKVTIE